MHTRGMVQPFWGTKHRDLEYQREPFNSPDDVSTWRELGYSQEYFTGLMYDMKNTMPDWTEEFYKIFKGNNIGLSFYKMETCNILPYHQDTYNFYKKKFNIKNQWSIWRAIIFLEDWKPGHIFEIDYVPITDWRAGEYVLWQYDAPHMAANLGTDPRYTLQITFTDV